VIQAVERAVLQFATKRVEKEGQKAGVDVARVQRLLKALGYEPGSADGIAGVRTRDAIRSFQQAAGLRPDGEISGDLVRRLTLEDEGKRLEEERKRGEDERHRAKEKRRRVEREKGRAEERRRKIVAPRPVVLPPSQPDSGYKDVQVAKIVSGAFVNELKNKKVRILANYFQTSSLYKLRANLAKRYVPFNTYNYNQPSGFLVVLVPRHMADKAFEMTSMGQFVLIYGQLVAHRRTGNLVLVADRIERLHMRRN